MVWRLKFGFARAGAEEIGALLAKKFGAQLRDKEYCIVPAPTSTGRVRQRGYDQAALIARSLARLTDNNRETLLVRHGQQQQHGASRRVRKVQLQHAFQVVHPDRVVDRRILLVDDVVTTGATFEAAARVLKAAGAKSVDALAFAQA